MARDKKEEGSISEGALAFRVNLSWNAYSIFNDDMLAMNDDRMSRMDTGSSGYPEHSTSNRGYGNISGFFNDVLENIIAGIDLDGDPDISVDDVLSAELSKTKGVAIRGRLSKANFIRFSEILERINAGRSEKDKFAMSWLLKAVFEVRYANIPTISARERILYRARFLVINEAIKEHRWLKIKMRQRDKGRFKTVEIIPWRIMHDPTSSYSYVVGFSKRENSDEIRSMSHAIHNMAGTPEKLRIETVAAVRDIKKANLDMLKQDVEDRGIPFLSGETRLYEVHLSKKGVSMYNQIRHLRPKYFERVIYNDGSALYRFRCSADQIRFYFPSLLGEAKILSPDWMAAYFAESYRKAAALYAPHGNSEN